MSDEDDDGVWYQARLADRQSDAWEEFLMTGRPSALAIYLEAEGEVDASVRQILIDLLRNGPMENNAGGKDRWRDYVTFVKVGSIQSINGISKTAACRRYAERTNQTQRTVELQFDRGSKVFSPECDVFERVDPKSEK